MKVVKWLTAFLCVNLFIAAGCLAATYYVKSDGDDNLNGLTDATAWQSLYKASRSAGSGDTILLRRGDAWYVTQDRNASHRVGIGLTIQSNNIKVGAYGTGKKPVIDASARTESKNVHKQDSGYAPVMIEDGVRSVTVQDLDLRGPALGPALDFESHDGCVVRDCDLRGSGWTDEALIQAQTGDNLVVEGCFFDQITGNGKSSDTTGYSKTIEIFGGSGHIIRGNRFYGFASGGAVRFSNGGTGALVENNYFYGPDHRDNVCWALVIRSCDGGTYVVRNNVFDLSDGGSKSGSDLRAMAFWDDHASTTRKIFNNTIISDGAGTGYWGSGSRTLVYNNIHYNLQVGFDNPSSSIELRNNVFCKVDKLADGSVGRQESTSYDDPALYNPNMTSRAATDARLTASSLCAIGMGYNSDSDIPKTDFAGNARSNPVDIGAFQFTEGTVVQVPPAPTDLKINADF